MVDKRFFINPPAVLFHDLLDEKNCFETIVFNWKSGTFLKIDKNGYVILRLIEEKPNIHFSQIILETKQRENIIFQFLERMVEENIVLIK